MLYLSGVSVNYASYAVTVEARPFFALSVESDATGVELRRIEMEMLDGTDRTQDSLLWQGALEALCPSRIELPTEIRLKPHRSYRVRFKVCDARGEKSAWSQYAAFFTGFLEGAQWTAAFIRADDVTETIGVAPVFNFVKTFTVSQKVREARLYITAKGLYAPFLNGARVGDDALTPGDMDYTHHLAYQTYALDGQIKMGENTLSVLVGDGWYKGYLSSTWHRNYYGEHRELLCELHLLYEDHSTEVIPSDDTFSWSYSNISLSEIYIGETCDASAKPDPVLRKAVVAGSAAAGYLHPSYAAPAHYLEPVAPLRILKTTKGETVLDFGRVLSGVTELHVAGPKGSRVYLEYADTLGPDGCFYNDNVELFSLRERERPQMQRICYTLSGEGMEIYRPLFTYQAFRYVRVVEFPTEPSLDHFVAYPISSFTRQTGTFQCGDELLNVLYRNTVNTEKATFMDIPIAGPMRAERLGWTGDNQLMFPLAMRTMFESYGFLTKWLEEVRLAQSEDGQVGTLAPYVNFEPHSSKDNFSPQAVAIWGDAAVICPWLLYEFYGDLNILRRYKQLAKKYVDYMRASGDEELLFTEGETFGDWFALDNGEDSYPGKTDKGLLGSFYYYRSASLLVRILSALKDPAHQEYSCLADRIREKLSTLYFCGEKLINPTQTSCAMAIEFGIARNPDTVGQQLAELVSDAGDHLLTGFVGASMVLQALCHTGHEALAVRLVRTRDYPSWLYTVEKGATTIWEHFNGVKPDGSLWSPNMNSFCHLTFGSVIEWMHAFLLGVRQQEQSIAYSNILFAPVVSRAIGFARGSFDTVHGTVRSEWEFSGRFLKIELAIPYGTSCKVVLPHVKRAQEYAQQLRAQGLCDAHAQENNVVFCRGSGIGSYCYESTK